MFELPNFVHRIVGKITCCFDAAARAESRAITEFLAKRDVNKFVRFLYQNKPKFPSQINYEINYSRSGRISLCYDIYGPEIEIDGRGWLDVNHTKYKVSLEDANKIIDAILGNVPTISLSDVKPPVYQSPLLNIVK